MPVSRVRGLVRGNGGALVFFVATSLVNVTNFGFHVIVSRALGTEAYGGLSALLVLLVVLSVPLGALQLAATHAQAGAPRDASAQRLLWGTFLVGMGALGNARNVATCSGYGYGSGYGYSTPAPQLTLNLSASVAISGHPVTASGVLTQNGCVLPGVSVAITRRAVTSGVPTGLRTTLITVTTDANGAYSAPITQVYNSVLQSRASAGTDRPAVNSPARVLRLLARVGASAPVNPHTSKARICGRVAPSHVGAILTLARGINGVWVPQDLKRVLSDNSYCFSILLPAGRTPIKIRMQTTTTNLFGQRSFYATRT